MSYQSVHELVNDEREWSEEKAACPSESILWELAELDVFSFGLILSIPEKEKEREGSEKDSTMSQ